MAVEEEPRDEGAADQVQDDAGPDRAGLEPRLAVDDGGGEDAEEEGGQEEGAQGSEVDARKSAPFMK